MTPTPPDGPGPEIAVEMPLKVMRFLDTITANDRPPQVIDTNESTHIITGDRPVDRYLPLGDLRIVHDEWNRRWLVAVEDGHVITGFALEHNDGGDLVICMAE